MQPPTGLRVDEITVGFADWRYILRTHCSLAATTSKTSIFRHTNFRPRGQCETNEGPCKAQPHSSWNRACKAARVNCPAVSLRSRRSRRICKTLKRPSCESAPSVKPKSKRIDHKEIDGKSGRINTARNSKWRWKPPEPEGTTPALRTDECGTI